MADKLKWDGDYHESMVCPKCTGDVANMVIKADIVVGLTWNDQNEKIVELGCDDWIYNNIRLECSCGMVFREDRSDQFTFCSEEDFWVVKVKKEED